MFKKMLPHICIDMAVIFLVLWVIDRFNSAMHMLGRDTFKIPFVIFLVLVIVESVLLIRYQRRSRHRNSK
jgi:membrane protein implicated in regulation of membrane protease activity